MASSSTASSTARLMARGLTPDQQRAYRHLRELAVRILADYPTTQRVLAEALSATQPFINNVLKGRMTSVGTLEGIVRVLIASVNTDHRRQLLDAIEHDLPVLRPQDMPRPKLPRARFRDEENSQRRPPRGAA